MVEPGQILRGSLFNEPMRVETIRQAGPDTWVLGLVGLQSERFRSATFSAQDLAGLQIVSASCTYAGDGALLRLGLQAHLLGIAYEFDPYFGLSISRADPLPHQLEAVGELRLIEVKGIGGERGTIGLTPNEKRVAEDRRECYWLYVVTHCDADSRLQIVKDPASLSWHEVKKVDHYWVSVDAVREPMMVREEPLPPEGVRL
ncbi:MAG: DUF3883 domain-containing protein [candidate division NC10 bacterium]